jgi:hypothetical protein
MLQQKQKQKQHKSKSVRRRRHRVGYMVSMGLVAAILQYATLYQWWFGQPTSSKESLAMFPSNHRSTVTRPPGEEEEESVLLVSSSSSSTAAVAVANDTSRIPESVVSQLMWFQRFQSFPTLDELQKSTCPPRLELLHIPKSGGTTMEKSAFQQANLAWGCCHFHLNFKKKPWADMCPLELQTVDPLDQWPAHKVLNDLWHYPLHWLERNTTLAAHPMPSNPYHNVAVTNSISTEKTITSSSTTATCPPQEQELHFFAVVRDPYDRAISEYYFQAGYAVKKHLKKLQDPTFLNTWISKAIQRYRTRRDNPSPWAGWPGKLLHWIPQSEYIFDDQGRRRVRHVLKFENLTSEFQELMERYHVNVTLSEQKDKSGLVPAESRLGPQNLTEAVRTELESLYANDFALGNYPLFHPE